MKPCEHCGEDILQDVDHWIHDEGGLEACADGKTKAEPDPEPTEQELERFFDPERIAASQARYEQTLADAGRYSRRWY